MFDLGLEKFKVYTTKNGYGNGEQRIVFVYLDYKRFSPSKLPVEDTILANEHQIEIMYIHDVHNDGTIIHQIKYGTIIKIFINDQDILKLVDESYNKHIEFAKLMVL